MGEPKALLRFHALGEVRLPIPNTPHLEAWGGGRDHHRYLITFDPLHPVRGYGASYKDARDMGAASRYLRPPEEGQFPDLATAQAACEADVRRLLGRLS